MLQNNLPPISSERYKPSSNIPNWMFNYRLCKIMLFYISIVFYIIYGPLNGQPPMLQHYSINMAMSQNSGTLDTLE